MDDRLLHPISDGELERRWTAVRAEMRARGIEALAAAGISKAIDALVARLLGG